MPMTTNGTSQTCAWRGCDRHGSWFAVAHYFCSIHHPSGREHIRQMAEALEEIHGDAYLGMMEPEGPNPDSYEQHAHDALERILNRSRSALRGRELVHD